MRVLCINGDFSNAGPRSRYLRQVPKELKEYTIREVIKRGIVVGYLLEEICGGFFPSGIEVSFDSSRFIPLEEINTSKEQIEEECLINFH